MCKKENVGFALIQPSAFASANIDLSSVPGLTPAGKEFIESLARRAPTKAPVCRNLVRSIPWSHKMQRSVGWDDFRLDFRHAVELEMTSSVLAYWKWMPHRTHPYGDSTVPAGTTIVVLTATGGEIHEVVRDQHLRKRCYAHPQRFVQVGTEIRDLLAEGFAAKLGLRHRIIRGSSLSATRTSNRVSLSAAKPAAVPPQLEAAVLEMVDCRPGTTVAQVVEAHPDFTIQMLMHLLVLGRLFIDLENERITADDYLRIRLYRDEQQMQIGYAASLARSEIPVCSSQVALDPGTRIAMRDEHFTVIQHEGDFVVLVSDDGRCIPYNRFALGQMLAEGKARAFVPVDVIEKEGMTKLRLATAAERAFASKKFQLVAHLLKYVDHPAAARRDGVLITEREARLLRLIRKAPAGTHPLVPLLPDFSGRGRCQLAPEVDARMDQLLEQAFAESPRDRKSVAYHYGLLLDACKQLNRKPPSEETFRVAWHKKSKDVAVRQLFAEPDVDTRTRSIANLLEEGLQHVGFYGELACIDSTQLPLSTCDSVTKERMGPVYLTVMLDVYSRCILAFHLDFRPPSAATALALLQTCVERHGFLPSSIFCDNGPELRADAFIHALANNHVTQHYRPPLQPKFCGLVESLLGRVQEVFFKQLQGAIESRKTFGPKTERPEGCWDIWSLQEATAELLYEQLPNTLHLGIGMPPAARRDQAARCKLVSTVPSRDEFYKLTAQKLTRNRGRAVVAPGRGVRIRGLCYYTSEFDGLGTGVTKVEVLQHPTDLSFVWVKSPHTGIFVQALSPLYLPMSPMDGVQRRLFTSELLERRRIVGKASRRRLLRDVAVMISDAEARLSATVANRPALQPSPVIAQKSAGTPTSTLVGFPVQEKEMSA